MDDDIALLDKRIIIPTSLRGPVLKTLHSAHQGCTGMTARASTSVYWPGMNASILNFRADCRTCTLIAPSQSKEPLTLTPTPEWPFQQICADYFHIGNHNYLTMVDRFSGWISLHHFKNEATAELLVKECRSLFMAYGVPEEFCSDGGPQFKSEIFKKFLNTWGVRHRISSAEYPQSNGRAELAVKTSKRIIYDSITENGSLDNDKIAKALLQYRNTPLPDIKLSPAQILFHRQLRDFLPVHRSHFKLHEEWLSLAKQREQLLYRRNLSLQNKYNVTAHTLKRLDVGTKVVLQNQQSRKKNPLGSIRRYS